MLSKTSYVLRPRERNARDVRCHINYHISKLSKNKWARRPHGNHAGGTALPLSTRRYPVRPLQSEESSILPTPHRLSTALGAICDEPFILPRLADSSRGLEGLPRSGKSWIISIGQDLSKGGQFSARNFRGGHLRPQEVMFFPVMKFIIDGPEKATRGTRAGNPKSEGRREFRTAV